MQSKAYKIKSEMHTKSKGNYGARRRADSSSANPMEAANKRLHRTGISYGALSGMALVAVRMYLARR
jgi:hypothetical protein